MLIGKQQITSLRVQKLQTALALYKSHWKEWILDKACFLNKKEVIIIVLYSQYYKHKKASEVLGISQSRVSFIYNRALIRLQNKTLYGRYIDWIADKMLQEAGITLYNDSVDEFLKMPLHCHKFSTRLQSVLGGLGNNLEEILKENSQKDLLTYRNFGKKSLLSLREKLEMNNCLYLLR